jgi:23S rRNA G2069 N7-methylase RlmK/C1962 C5-methylase RlmI
MANKRLIKKQLNGMIIDVLDECFSIQLYNESKTEATDKLIEEALSFGDDVLSKIHAANSKKDYPAIRQMMEDKGVYFIEELNGLQ